MQESVGVSAAARMNPTSTFVHAQLAAGLENLEQPKCQMVSEIRVLGQIWDVGTDFPVPVQHVPEFRLAPELSFV